MYTLKNEEVRDSLNRGIKNGPYDNDYEFNRWFIRPRNRAEYYMTYLAVSRHLRGVQFKTCLEAGPGPGTWTRLLFRANPEAEFDLVDASEEMKNQFMLEMRGGKNVRYVVSDIMEYRAERPYDLFFSSRAVEYLDDKPGFFKKLKTLVKTGGRGLIATKNPKHGARKSKEPQHQGQISMSDMEQHLTKNGFIRIAFYPAVIRIPIVSRFTSELSEYIFHKRIEEELDINATNRIIESYLVTFERSK